MSIIPIVVKAKKRFGQNFLVDGEVTSSIADIIDPHEGQNLIEIGPGRGALTRLILKRCGSLRVIEIDRELVSVLQSDRELREHPGLDIIQGDALKIDFGSFADRGPMRIFGNLPYNISSPLIFHLLTDDLGEGRIEDLTFMLQQEVVRRLAAEIDSKAYGRLTVMAQFFCEVEPLLTVSPTAFAPQPQVVSEVVRLRPREMDPERRALYPYLSKVTIQAFSTRRKMIANSLSGQFTKDTLEDLGIDIAKRAENISVEQYVALAEHLRSRDEENSWKIIT